MQSTRSPLVALLVSSAFSSPVAHRVAARNPELRAALSRNKNLSEERWLELYTHKPKIPLEMAKSLAGRTLTRTQVEHLLSRETRAKVLIELVSNNDLDLDHQEQLLTSKGCTPLVASWWMSHGTVHPSLREQVATLAGGETFVKWLATTEPEDVPHERAAELLLKWKGWGSDGNWRSPHLYTLAGHRPELLPTMMGHEDWTVRKAAATSRHLRSLAEQEELVSLEVGQTEVKFWEYGSNNRQVLTGLCQNPNLHRALAETILGLSEMLQLPFAAMDGLKRRLEYSYTEISSPWEELPQGEELEAVREHIFDRKLFSSFVPKALWDVEVLGANPNLTPEQVREAAEVLGHVKFTPGTNEYRGAKALESVHGEGLVRWLEAGPWKSQRTQYPYTKFDGTESAASLRGGSGSALEWVQPRMEEDEAAWEVLITILENFEGTLAALVQVCRTI